MSDDKQQSAAQRPDCKNSGELPCYVLNETEKAILYNWYMYKANYQHDCAITQERMAEKAASNETELFLGDDLLGGQPKTPENWQIRKKIFLERYKMYRDKANRFLT